MRALLALVLFAPLAAEAGPAERHPLRLPGDAAMLVRAHPSERQVNFQFENKSAPPSGTVTIGPIEAHTIRDSKGREHFAISPLSGTRILGGSIAGTYNHGTAEVMLRWPPD